jgi:uncharacterized protein (DUF2147 family)
VSKLTSAGRRGYARVSTTDQDLTVQIQALKAAECDVIRKEKARGVTTKGRAELAAILDFIREGDVLVVTRIDRLARSIADLQDSVRTLKARGAALRATERAGACFLGLTLIKGMRRNGTSYDNGTITDPRDGSLYSALMRLSPDGQKQEVRGYLAISLFGRTPSHTRRFASERGEFSPNGSQSGYSVRIPTKPANAFRSEADHLFRPEAGRGSNLMSSTLRRAAAGRWDDVFLWLLGQADGSGMRRLRMLSPASSI